MVSFKRFLKSKPSLLTASTSLLLPKNNFKSNYLICILILVLPLLVSDCGFWTMPRFSLYLSNGRATVGVLFFLLLLNCLLFEVFEEFLCKIVQHQKFSTLWVLLYSQRIQSRIQAQITVLSSWWWCSWGVSSWI